MNYFDHIQKTFALEHLPANIRASKFMGQWPFIRRYQRIPVGLSFLPAGGRFSYTRSGQRRNIKFNGRNIQFHALYDSHFRYGYELETTLLLAALLRGNDSFLDIGSNWGYYSLLAAALPEYRGAIYAFEPNPRTFADLTNIIEQADVKDRVTACHLGVGSTVCELTVAEADRFNTGLSRLTANGGGQKIPVKPLDSLSIGRPAFIKIDAEGMEMEILAGAVRTLAEAKPFIVFENFLDFQAPENTYATIRFLEQNAYRVFAPALEFSLKNSAVLATYGRDYTPLVESGGQPQSGVVEVSARRRFLLGDHLNLLAVHETRLNDLWESGVKDFGKM